MLIEQERVFVIAERFKLQRDSLRCNRQHFFRSGTHSSEWRDDSLLIREAAMNAWSKTLATEVAPHGVRVNGDPRQRRDAGGRCSARRFYGGFWHYPGGRDCRDSFAPNGRSAGYRGDRRIPHFGSRRLDHRQQLHCGRWTESHRKNSHCGSSSSFSTSWKWSAV